jgi:hypothetical protein
MNYSLDYVVGACLVFGEAGPKKRLFEEKKRYNVVLIATTISHLITKEQSLLIDNPD